MIQYIFSEGNSQEWFLEAYIPNLLIAFSHLFLLPIIALSFFYDPFMEDSDADAEHCRLPHTRILQYWTKQPWR